MSIDQRISEARRVLEELELPRAQLNDRTALCLLALINLSHAQGWHEGSDPLRGITPIMDWIRENYGREYKPNTRETFRRQSMHQFVEAGIAVHNPDQPGRSVNSPNNVYQISPATLTLLRTYGTEDWNMVLAAYKVLQPGLRQKYARPREMELVPVTLPDGSELNLSPGVHSVLIKGIIEDFGSRFTPGGKLLYAGDTGDKYAYFDEALLSSLGVAVDSHGKMPDVIIYFEKENWLILAEAVTSHGPVDGKRHTELTALFSSASAGLVYLTAFPDRSTMAQYSADIAWETEVWVSEDPSHLIHFNGDKFLGPYQSKDN
jgi:BsuBI/PstI restriction endonuclease domain/BsuBI/PstI restriction endonuclease HTH domain